MTITKKNEKYYCRFQINGERHHYLCKGAKDIKEAQKLETAFKYQIMQEQSGIKKVDKPIPLSRLLQLYTDYNEQNNRQKRQIEKERAVEEYFGKSRNVKTIISSEIEAFRVWLKTEKNLSNGTINRYYSYLSKAFNLGIRDKLLEYNPCKLKLLEEPKETIKFYNKTEQDKLIKTINKELQAFRPFVVCVFQTGLRISNVQYLRWEWIDIRTRIIEILPQHNKGKKLIRLYISDELLKELKAIGIRKEGYVFINPNTGNIWINPCRYLKKLCEKAKIKYIGFHGIRHSVGTELAEKGVPINVIQAVMAHSDIRTTMKYIHLKDNAIKEAITVLNSYN